MLRAPFNELGIEQATAGVRRAGGSVPVIGIGELPDRLLQSSSLTFRSACASFGHDNSNSSANRILAEPACDLGAEFFEGRSSSGPPVIVNLACIIHSQK